MMVFRPARECFALFFALACLLAGAAASGAPFSLDTTPGRLPKDVVPRAYRIALVPDPAALRFTGTEEVTLDVRTPTRLVQFDSANERLSRVRFDGAPVAAVHSDDAAQLTTVRLASVAPRGRHTLSFTYVGRLQTSPRGWYVQTYGPGGRRQLLATFFESLDARRMFPGWDEPAFRARFTLTVTLPAAWAVVSNMPVAQRRVQGDRATTTFATTPPMSTYLVALAAGDLAALHDRRGPTAFGIWAPREEQGQGAFALAEERAILRDYDAYYGVTYPLPKLDGIAIPGFGGGMENWGAIFYDDSGANTVLTPTDSLDERQTAVSLMTHEMAHLWTGDLVTMAWWDDIWLNESFAEWQSTRETDRRYPAWHWFETQDSEKESALEADALHASHPLVQPLLDERTADAGFDAAITYAKGEAFLRMLETYLGPRTFQSGLRRYIRAHAYSNATSDDLWNALSAAAGRDLRPLAHDWTVQAGFPLVRVRATCDADGKRTVSFAQQRYFAAGSTSSPEHWAIPLRLRSGTEPERSVLLRAGGQTAAAGRCGTPFVANAGGIGYYRVSYDEATFAADRDAFTSLPTADQIALLDDTWALAGSGDVPLGAYLSLAAALRGTDERAWDQVLDALEAIATAVRGTPAEAAYLERARALVAPLAAQLGWDPHPGDAPTDGRLRTMVYDRLGAWGDPAVIAEARRRFAGPPIGDGAMQATIVRIVARSADRATFERLHELARTSASSDERFAFYDALMRVRDETLAEEALRIALSPELDGGLDEYRYGLVLTVADAFPELAWNTFRAHSAALLLPAGAAAPEAATDELPEAFWDGVPIGDLQAWFAANVPTERTIGIPRGLERVRVLQARKARLIAGLAD